MSGTVRIAILANAAQARKELNGVAGVASGLGAKFSKLRAPAIAALGAIGLGAGKAISKASDLNETISKSDAVFGKNAASISAWSNGAAKNMGLSKASALESASSFGDMFNQIGFAGDASADMSKQVVQMSADLGSFNNLPTEDVLDRLSGAFRGEYDALQKVIPNISAARVQQEAMTATGKKSASALTAQEKAAAVLAIVQKDGARAMGDFARTSDQASNSQKIAAATSADMSAQLGMKLLPAYTAVLQVGIQFLDFLSKHTTAVAVVVAVVGTLAAAVLGISAAQTIASTAMAVGRGAVMAYTAAQWLLNAAMTANPIGLVVLAIVALVAIFVVAYRKSETFRNIVNASFRAVAAVGKAIWGGIKTAAVAVFNFITGYIKFQVNVWKTVIRTVTGAAKAVWNAIKAAASAVWSAITGLIKSAISRAVSIIRTVTGVSRAVWSAVKSAASSAWNAVKSSVSSAISAAKSKLSSLKSSASSVLNSIRNLFSPTALIGAGSRLMQGLADGVSRRIGAVVDSVRRAVQKIKDLLPGSPIKNGPLVGWNNGGAGKRLMGMLAYGIKAGAPSVRGSLASALTPLNGVKADLGARSGAQQGRGLGEVTINVNVAPTADRVAIGREVVGAIRAYENAGGRR